MCGRQGCDNDGKREETDGDESTRIGKKRILMVFLTVTTVLLLAIALVFFRRVGVSRHVTVTGFPSEGDDEDANGPFSLDIGSLHRQKKIEPEP